MPCCQQTMHTSRTKIMRWWSTRVFPGDEVVPLQNPHFIGSPIIAGRKCYAWDRQGERYFESWCSSKLQQWLSHCTEKMADSMTVKEETHASYPYPHSQTSNPLPPHNRCQGSVLDKERHWGVRMTFWKPEVQEECPAQHQISQNVKCFCTIKEGKRKSNWLIDK